MDTIPWSTAMASLGNRDTTLCGMGSKDSTLSRGIHTLLHGKDVLRDNLFHGKDIHHDILFRTGDIHHRAEDCHHVEGFLLRALDIRHRNSLSLGGNGLPTGGSR
jgi:hypothetical protein